MKSEWAHIPFEDVCESMTKGPFGSDIKKSLYVPKSADTYKVYIQVNAIEKDATLGDYYISKEYFDSKMLRFEVKPDDYIITCDGTLGRYLRLPQTMERGIISASLLRITLKPNIVPRYFEYLWDGYLMSRLTSDIRNSALVHLPSATKIGKVLIPLPTITEQESIAAELDLLSGILEKQRLQLKELNSLAQSIFYDMFGDPVENEKGWGTSELNSVCDVRDGTHDSPSYQDEGYPLVTSKNITDDGISFSDVNFISKEDFDAISKRSYVDDGDIVMPMIGTIGKPTIVRKEREFAIKNVALIKFFPNSAVLNTFIKAIIASSSYDVYMRSKNKGGTQKFIALGDIRKLRIPVPPLGLQQSFDTKIEAIEQQKALINQSLVETQKLFDYTMDKYFG